ncbi:MAG: SIS domain-containing protein [Spirochaetota bacterium]
MKNTNAIADGLFASHPVLVPIRPEFDKAFDILCTTYRTGKKVLLCGNGGSFSDSAHFAGELMKSFVKKRPLPDALSKKLSAGGELSKRMAEKLEMPLRAIPLFGNDTLTTAYMNDVDAELIFAQMLLGLGDPGDTLVGLSTSGNAKNVIAAMELARAMDIRVIGITGRDGGAFKALSDACIIAPESETFRIQEFHLPIYHTLALMIEEEFF